MGAVSKVVGLAVVPVKVAGGAANAAGEASTAVIVGGTNAVNGVIKAASGAGISVIGGATKATSGVTEAAAKLLKKAGAAANRALAMKGGKRNRTNRNRKNKNRSNKNRSNKNRKNKNRTNRKNKD